jgi:hypothetical protein
MLYGKPCVVLAGDVPADAEHVSAKFHRGRIDLLAVATGYDDPVAFLEKSFRQGAANAAAAAGYQDDLALLRHGESPGYRCKANVNRWAGERHSGRRGSLDVRTEAPTADAGEVARSTPAD